MCAALLCRSLSVDCEQLKLEAIKRIKGDLEAEQPKKKKAVSAALLLKGLPTRVLVEAP